MFKRGKKGKMQIMFHRFMFFEQTTQRVKALWEDKTGKAKSPLRKSQTRLLVTILLYLHDKLNSPLTHYFLFP